MLYESRYALVSCDTGVCKFLRCSLLFLAFCCWLSNLVPVESRRSVLLNIVHGK
jgi:hypothetical protein